MAVNGGNFQKNEELSIVLHLVEVSWNLGVYRFLQVTFLGKLAHFLFRVHQHKAV